MDKLEFNLRLYLQTCRLLSEQRPRPASHHECRQHRPKLSHLLLQLHRKTRIKFQATAVTGADTQKPNSPIRTAPGDSEQNEPGAEPGSADGYMLHVYVSAPHPPELQCK